MQEPCVWVWVGDYWYDAYPEPGQSLEDLVEDQRRLGWAAFAGRSGDPPAGPPVEERSLARARS